MSKIFFTVKCKTNLHVGSGQANYGVVDQLVQRDPTFQYPTIHASSLKGAIKEYCYSICFPNMKAVFGSEKKDGKTCHNDSHIGGYKFFDANLLAIPVRCDKQAYVHITCPDILKDLSELLPDDNSLRKELNVLANVFSDSEPFAYTFSNQLSGATIEDFDIQASYVEAKKNLLTNNLRKLFEYEIVIVQNKYLKRLTNDLHLPVIARNYLENGESKNLWYEQVVPRLTMFWSMCMYSGEDVLFLPNLLKEEKPLIQIGANGSIGYGYCLFTEILKIN